MQVKGRLRNGKIKLQNLRDTFISSVVSILQRFTHSLSSGWHLSCNPARPSSSLFYNICNIDICHHENMEQTSWFCPFQSCWQDSIVSWLQRKIQWRCQWERGDLGDRRETRWNGGVQGVLSRFPRAVLAIFCLPSVTKFLCLPIRTSEAFQPGGAQPACPVAPLQWLSLRERCPRTRSEVVQTQGDNAFLSIFPSHALTIGMNSGARHSLP